MEGRYSAVANRAAISSRAANSCVEQALCFDDMSSRRRSVAPRCRRGCVRAPHTESEELRMTTSSARVRVATCHDARRAELRGLGLTGNIDRPITYEKMAHDAVKLVDHLGLSLVR